MDDEKTNNSSITSVVWDIAVNSQHVKYDAGNHIAELIGKACTIRTPFWNTISI